MSENDSSQEKTEQPTPKRLQDAKDKGEVPRSKELNTNLLLLASAAMFFISGKNILASLMSIMRNSFHFSREVLYDTDAMLIFIAQSVQQVTGSLLPFFIALLVVTLISPVLLGGWMFSTKSLAFKGERLNPLAGIKKMFSVKSLVELGKAVLKFSLILSCGILIIKFRFLEILTLNNQPVNHAIPHGMKILGVSFFILTSVLIIISAIDIPYQLWEHTKKLRMSHQDIKDELKQTDVRPEVKQRINKIQREMSQQRIMVDVPKADVVITNPTHFAVALAYDQKNSNAPRVVAKGYNLMAFQIQKIAKDNDVEIVSSPQLARAIFFNAELYHEIPAGLYIAVAQVLAYIYQLKQYKKGFALKPNKLGELEVPEELKVESYSE